MRSVDQEGFAETWERCKPYMATALEKSGGHYGVDDLLKLIKEDRAIFYPILNGAAVFRVAVYPKKRRLGLWLIGGEVGEEFDVRSASQPVMEAAELLAKEHGCDGIECIGQIAYKRLLKPFGFKHKGVVLIKELGD